MCRAVPLPLTMPCRVIGCRDRNHIYLIYVRVVESISWMTSAADGFLPYTHVRRIVEQLGRLDKMLPSSLLPTITTRPGGCSLLFSSPEALLARFFGPILLRFFNALIRPRWLVSTSLVRRSTSMVIATLLICFSSDSADDSSPLISYSPAGAWTDSPSNDSSAPVRPIYKLTS
jgi:hypothetical protein